MGHSRLGWVSHLRANLSADFVNAKTLSDGFQGYQVDEHLNYLKTIHSRFGLIKNHMHIDTKVFVLQTIIHPLILYRVYFMLRDTAICAMNANLKTLKLWLFNKEVPLNLLKLNTVL